jgi:hypothetical protein
MAVVKSGASSDQWTVDPTSKAGRVTLYDAAGNCLQPTELARGAVSIVVRQSAATAAGAVVWGLRNSSGTRTINVLRILFNLGFDGTGAATLMRYEFLKATGVTSFTGGAAVTPSIFKTALTQAVGADPRVLNTGLTLTGATFGGPLYTVGWGRLTPSATAQACGGEHVIDFAELGMGPFELAQNEVLCIRNGPTNPSVIGDTLTGSVFFVEK